MQVESLEERTVEVPLLPEGVDEELLFLYFENRRRSGGGPLVSVEKKGNRATLVFEDAEAAAQVLSKGNHVLHNVELRVRKPAAKDQCRLLLQGINPNTDTEMIELYVENMLGLHANDYQLYPSSGRDFILLHLNQPLYKDFQTLSVRVSKRTLDGATVTLEQVEQTDSVLVEKLHPGTTQDLLMLYFESKRGGNQRVRDVTMLSEGTAKVSFVNHQSLGPVLDQQHKLEGAELVVKPYFDFLQPTEATSQNSGSGSEHMTEGNSEDLGDIQMQTNEDSQSSSPTTSELLPAVVQETAEETIDDKPEDVVTLSSHVAFDDPVKLALFKLSPLSQDIVNAHPDFTIEVKDDGILIEGSDNQKLEQIKQTIMDFLGNMAQTNFTLEPEQAQFLARKEVKERLLQTINQTMSPTIYSVSDSEVVVTSLSQNSAHQACSFLTSQMCHFSMPLDTEYECMLYCREWLEFLQALDFSSVKERGGNIDVLTLKGMESEKQTAILKFLSTPIERETVITMEPGALKYIQNHCHHLLADMDQVSIYPLEGEDVCGLKIHGHPATCQMAEEVLQGMVSSVCTKAIPINAPGVARFLHEADCQSLLKEMESKFEVYISPQFTPWVPMPVQDIFDAAWQMMSHRNFRRVSVDGPAQELQAHSMQTDGARDKDLLEEAKKIVSAIDGRVEENSDRVNDMDDVDLYTAEEPTSLQDLNSDVMAGDGSQSSAEGNYASGLAQGLSRDLKEEAQLSLAIQYSMESSQWYLDDEEEQLQKALELSMNMMDHEASSSGAERSPQPKLNQQKKDINVALQETIKAANTIQLVVFAGYVSDLTRVEIAFGKKVSQKQMEEKLECKSMRDMSEYHRTCLEMIKRKHSVEIQVQGTIITVSGFKHFQPAGVCDVKLLLEKVNNSVPGQEILRTVQWVVHDQASSDTTPYSDDATVFIENAWRMKLKQLDILLDNQPHVINFEKMTECNIASKKTVKISRKLLISGALPEGIPEEEYSLLSHMPESTKVDEESDEFQNVVKNFYETIHGFHSKIRIIQVEKLMNRLLYNQFKLKKASIEQRATYPEVERTLYHGTSENSVKEICVQGFNRSFCGKNATVYGQGVYFAVESSLSVEDRYSPPNADGHKFIFVSRVLTGDYTKGCHSMKTAPLKESDNIPLRYDSVTDNLTKPTMFVIFNDTQAFPEYLITCQSIRH
ncbi:protein mono-ADP-ribosyltransferase PARP10 [Hippoglossus stenolepis]|uniref:protein mono-ADP-ribosyltransferase PARP10 n=1 Tax=Hippoglossus stenolepis TaxID=195615 RepID=UPI00159C2707|nr:protein mono-ADP-ribosyltransferase PARP10 [Hippoglossus stenolepis]